MSDHAAVVGWLADWPHRLPTDPLPDTARHACAERVRQAVCAVAAGESVGRRDLAGLIGHWLNRESAGGRGDRVRVPAHAQWPTEREWADAGVSVVTREPGQFVLGPAVPWRPKWLVGDSPAVPLAAAFAETRRRLTDQADCPPADPCLTAAVGEKFAQFTGHGQQQAVRAAFLIPPGETLLAVLPTGAGKSLVGLAPAVLGHPARGTTLVVVPTVALAFDQEDQARKLLSQVGADTSLPLAWHAGLSEADRQLVKRAVRDGTQPILFASPEAVLQALSPSLFDSASAGLLRAVVIDEAHLVAQWGNDFRPEFQAVAGLRDQLLADCPPDARFRTTLLTATLTQESFATLRKLFGELHTVAAVHLRPEPAYWVRKAAGWEQQREWVLEACRRVPRPFLLYVTQTKHAEEWAEMLRDDGMKRVRYVHGKSGDRGAVLDLWRKNQIDAVVATSAFGLGMDKADVRAVVHACVPETVDRYYQEVGRGGRDGAACVAVGVYTDANLREADGLNRERVITTELGLDRWEAMFNTRPPGSEKADVFSVSLRATRPGVQDNDANVGWNLQTLNLLARAGLIRLRPDRPPVLERQAGESDEAFSARFKDAFDCYFATTRVEPLGGQNLRDKNAWDTIVQPERLRTAGAAGDQLALLKKMFRGGCEFADALAEVYTVDDGGTSITPTAVCGGCPACWGEGVDRTDYVVPHPTLPALPPSQPDPRLLAALGLPHEAEFGVVTYTPPAGTREARRWDDLLLRVLFPRLISLGVREFSTSPRWAESPAFRRLHHLCPERYLLFTPPDADPDAESWPVPRVTLLDPTDPRELPPELVRLTRPFHLLLVPEGVRDPTGRLRTVSLSAFLAGLDR